MKITFLGTGAAALQKNRDYTATAIEVGDSVYLVDAGASVFSKMQNFGIDPQRLRAVFVTHAHYDHVAGLPMLVDIFSWSKSYGNIPISYYLPEERSISSLVGFVDSMGASASVHGDFNVYRQGLVYEDENIKLLAIPTEHIKNDDGSNASYAFALYAEQKCILFSGDLSRELDTERIFDFIKEEKINLFISELAHFSPSRLIEKIAENIPQRVYFNHIAESEKLLSEIDELKKSECAIEICAAHDGMTLEV
ncbi:MAG: MBL fold metallo-hydrolase [Ruminococcaceae bacterium]|nr:MBL fold metallo-hydrolase [Oscillospiraceae bacterium]